MRTVTAELQINRQASAEEFSAGHGLDGFLYLAQYAPPPHHFLFTCEFISGGQHSKQTSAQLLYVVCFTAYIPNHKNYTQLYSNSK
jgi:hypothetical protein